jgi:hypothetical protein
MARISRLNKLSEPEKKSIYRLLIPDKVFKLFEIDAETGKNKNGQQVVWYECPPGSAEGTVEVKSHREDFDPIFYIEVADAKDLLQLYWYFIQVNDIRVPRINTDVTPDGKSRWLFWDLRNVPEEERALKTGLAPGQVRPGLRLTDDVNHCLDRFCSTLGILSIYMEALFYHTAIAFERNGFRYLRGEQKMRLINKEFQPGGRLYKMLDGRNIFRQREFYNTVRGRSWAIHDGILDDLADPEIGKWVPPRMYRMVEMRHDINSCPEGCW